MRLIVFVVALLGVASTLGADARKLTPEEKAQRKADAEVADKEIRFIEQNQLQETIAQGVWFIFFGSHTCAYTQRLTPVWLDFQKEFDGLYKPSKTFGVGKVECGDAHVEEEMHLARFCEDKFHTGGSYPVVQIFIDGVKTADFEGPDTPTDMIKFVNAYEAEYKEAKANPSAGKEGGVQKIVEDAVEGAMPVPKVPDRQQSSSSQEEEMGAAPDAPSNADSSKEKKIEEGGIGAAGFFIAGVAVTGFVLYRRKTLGSRGRDAKYRSV